MSMLGTTIVHVLVAVHVNGMNRFHRRLYTYEDPGSSLIQIGIYGQCPFRELETSG